MDDLFTFDKIPGTPAWYYKKFPGFYNVECYKILSQWNAGVPNTDVETSLGEDLTSTNQQNKKRGREDEEEKENVTIFVDIDGDSSLR